jgi:DNA-binding transcriptional ArsR family regulator
MTAGWPYLACVLTNMLANRALEEDRLSSIFAALADPTQRAILERLRLGAASVNALAEPFNISLPAISRQLKVLERAGLIDRGREAQWRPCQLNVEAIREVVDWAGSYRPFWEESFSRLDDLLHELGEEDLR